jgi:hypothetical protein
MSSPIASLAGAAAWPAAPRAQGVALVAYADLGSLSVVLHRLGFPAFDALVAAVFRETARLGPSADEGHLPLATRARRGAGRFWFVFV